MQSFSERNQQLSWFSSQCKFTTKTEELARNKRNPLSLLTEHDYVCARILRIDLLGQRIFGGKCYWNVYRTTLFVVAVHPAVGECFHNRYISTFLLIANGIFYICSLRRNGIAAFCFVNDVFFLLSLSLFFLLFMFFFCLSFHRHSIVCVQCICCCGKYEQVHQISIYIYIFIVWSMVCNMNKHRNANGNQNGERCVAVTRRQCI